MRDKTVPWSNKITNIQSNVLEALATYKFLTLRQLLILDIGTTQYKYLWKQVASLRDRKKALIERRDFNTEERLGRVEDMYFLTKYGASILVHELFFPEEKIRRPKSKAIANKDYFHRKYTIDFHIQLLKWTDIKNIDVEFFYAYFDKSGNNRTSKNLKAKTKINFGGQEYIIPDAIFKLQSQQKQRLFLFEMHNGNDTFRLIKQLHKHAYALIEKHTHLAFLYPPEQSYTILIVFEKGSTKNAFIKRMMKEGSSFAQIHQYFLCKSLEDLEQYHFDEGWSTVFGEVGSLKM